ncbi:short-chain fatty acyl-CoA regulator family protein [Parazoarcus communis]|uniref:Cro/Cl family transcriptional regulator n=1 Tax=Parazoarcus communis SWub3 = DSM 12120 TaxID=1121029 RepID=A0A323V1V1_9RHOO|nr:short-chain fatty acyl-CoA regulator family protein [Parazoarcus communis]NMG69238.1 ImmA/IrrE family metallo-endopeptidase [Parazoarcus communis SWub3 = DSM 12120]PZA18481.1 Cro/Cl family transcriptional regulator [Azoarcus communis] [Parazoarcus communis SWub3 = DSM 12120]
MKKVFTGVRVRRLREEKGLTQAALARLLEISPSYLNQIEQNQRPLTVPVLLRISSVLGVDVQRFSDDDEGRLVAELSDVLGDAGLAVTGEKVAMSEIRELAAQMPAVARALLTLDRRRREAEERLSVYAARFGDSSGDALAVPLPHEEVRDFFYARHNHIVELDDMAERMAEAWGVRPGEAEYALTARLLDAHGVQVLSPAVADSDGFAFLREFEPARGVLHLSPLLDSGQRAFQIATQLALLEAYETIEALVGTGGFRGEEACALARIGLANYFAGALILPYGRFLAAAEEMAYDIDRLGRRFGVGFETVCHRLSTLQRPGARGVPFIFVRVDRAGNISKRQSATDFHFSRVGGSCPLWSVYEAFAQPERIVTQLASMPDGRAYLWIARTVTHRQGGWGSPAKTFSIGLGCDLRHAARLVYARGVPLDEPAVRTPIGMACKVCDRPDCPQRAFPPVGGRAAADPNRCRFEPYGSSPGLSP